MHDKITLDIILVERDGNFINYILQNHKRPKDFYSRSKKVLYRVVGCGNWGQKYLLEGNSDKTVSSNS